MTLLRSPQQDPEESGGAPCSHPRLPEMQLGVCGWDKSEDGREHFPFFRKIPASSLLLEYSFQDKLFSLQEQLPWPDCSRGFSPPGVRTSRGCRCSRTCQGWWHSLTHVLLWGQHVHQPPETLGAPESLRHKASPQVLVTGWSVVCPGAPGLIRAATPGITPPAPLGGRAPPSPTWSLLRPPRPCAQDQGPAHVFCEGPHSKCFWFCKPSFVMIIQFRCYSPKAGVGDRQAHRHGCVLVTLHPRDSQGQPCSLHAHLAAGRWGRCPLSAPARSFHSSEGLQPGPRAPVTKDRG